MSNTFENPLPEPTIPNPVDEAQRDRLMRGFNAMPSYPDGGELNAVSAFYNQSILFRSEDVAEDASWAREVLQAAPDNQQFLEQLVARIVEEYPAETEGWIDKHLISDTAVATLKDAREARAANCVVRSTAFVGALQQAGIEAKVLLGDWVETSRQRVIGSYAIGDGVKYRNGKSTASFAGGVRFLEGEKGEEHAFALVKIDGKFYLADPALMAKGGDETPAYPLVREVSEGELVSRDISFDLPNGVKRHYTTKGVGIYTEPRLQPIEAAA